MAESSPAPVGIVELHQTLPRRRKLIIPDEECEPVDFHIIDDVDEEEKCSEPSSSRLSDFDDDSERSRRTQEGVVSLRLDEIAYIRGALAKEELDNLEDEDPILCRKIRNSQICYSCRQVQFGWLWRRAKIQCHLCQNVICTKCSKKMHLPSDRFDTIPVYTLSPASDEEEEENIAPMPNPVAWSDTRPRRPGAFSTLPRQRLARSQSQDLRPASHYSHAAATLPRGQPRRRPILERGLTMTAARLPPVQKTPSPTFSPTFQTRQKSICSPSRVDVTIEVCLLCHFVLSHAISESQMHVREEVGPVLKIHHQNLRPQSSDMSDSAGSDSVEEDFGIERR